MAFRTHFLALAALCGLGPVLPPASAEILRGPISGGGQLRITTDKNGAIRSLMIKFRVVSLPKDYAAIKPEWPPQRWGGDPATLDGVEGRKYVAYLSPQTYSQVTVRLTDFTGKSARITMEEVRVSSVEGYQETFVPAGGSSADWTVFPEVADPYPFRRVIKVPPHRISLEARETPRTGYLDFRFPGGASPASETLIGLNLRFYERNDNRWGLVILSKRRLFFEGDLVSYPKEYNVGNVPARTKIRPFVDGAAPFSHPPRTR